MAAPGPPHGISSHDASKFGRRKSNFVRTATKLASEFRPGTTSPRYPPEQMQPAGPAITMSLSFMGVHVATKFRARGLMSSTAGAPVQIDRTWVEEQLQELKELLAGNPIGARREIQKHIEDLR